MDFSKKWWLQLWPWLSVITGYFSGIIHSINGVLLVLRTGISGHNCGINIRKKIFGFRIFARDIPSGYVKMAIENGDL